MSSILLVDDDEDILLFTKLVLEDEGYRVETALTGQEALEKARENQYDVILLDYMLPDAKGNELALELNRLDESAVIFYLTGYYLSEEARGPGHVRDILLKPVSNDALLTAVRGALAPHVAGVGTGKVL
ncbi:MAG: response regulator [Candidatus Bathyarchaeota archaeon]